MRGNRRCDDQPQFLGDCLSQDLDAVGRSTHQCLHVFLLSSCGVQWEMLRHSDSPPMVLGNHNFVRNESDRFTATTEGTWITLSLGSPKQKSFASDRFQWFLSHQKLSHSAGLWICRQTLSRRRVSACCQHQLRTGLGGHGKCLLATCCFRWWGCGSVLDGCLLLCAVWVLILMDVVFCGTSSSDIELFT